MKDKTKSITLAMGLHPAAQAGYCFTIDLRSCSRRHNIPSAPIISNVGRVTNLRELWEIASRQLEPYMDLQFPQTDKSEDD